MGIEETKTIMLKEKEKSIRISRVPKRIKDSFIAYAEEEFEGDYGMTLKYLWDKYEESLYIINNFDTKLDYLIELSKNETDEQNVDGIKLLNGKELKGGIK